MKALEKNIAIEGRHLVKDFNPGGAATKVLKDVSLQIAQGEFASIMGPSGSGKSTLLYILGGLDTPTSGSVLLNGTDISRFDDEKMSRIRRQKIGFVFQFYNLIPNLSVEENRIIKATWNISWRLWDSPTAAGIRPGNCPAASSSGWLSPGP